MCLHVLCERRLGDASFWHPYLASLPPQVAPLRPARDYLCLLQSDLGLLSSAALPVGQLPAMQS